MPELGGLGDVLIGKPDIAALARVKRPVVTTWIARHRDGARPFPRPVTTAQGREWYRGADVVEWITAHGLGNNPAIREDLQLHLALAMAAAPAPLPAAPRPADDAGRRDTAAGRSNRPGGAPTAGEGAGEGRPDPDRAAREGAAREKTEQAQAFASLTALIALRAAIGGSLFGRSGDELLAAAAGIDPNDRALLRELRACGADLLRRADQADLLCDAAYGPASGFDTLARRWRSAAMAGAEAMADRAQRIIGAIGAALIDEQAAPLLLDPAPVDAGALLAVLAALPEHVTPRIAVGGGPERAPEPKAADEAAARLVRRCLLAHGVLPEDLVEPRDHRQAPAGSDDARPGLVLLRLPVPRGPIQLASAVSGLAHGVSGWHPGGHAIVIGPASVLTDAIAASAVDARRWDVVRGDRVRSVIRLPEGLLPGRPGTALAVWVLGPARDLPAGEKWMTVLDLAAVELTPDVVTAVAGDVLASTDSYAAASRHAFTFARVVPTAAVIARGAFLPVPPPAIAPGRPIGSADAAVTVQLAADRLTATALRPPPAMTVRAAARPASKLLPAGRLSADGHLSVLPGARIDPADLRTGGAVTVIGPEEVADQGTIGTRRIDRVVFTRRYPRAHYTEPGDVVFVTAGGRRAIVDHQGMHAVLAPARILRVRDPARSGLVPVLLAAHLSRRTALPKPTGSIRAGTGWRSWLLPVIDAAGASGAARVLADLDDHRAAVRDRLSAVDDLMQLLTARLADGLVTVEPAGGRDPAATAAGHCASPARRK